MLTARLASKKINNVTINRNAFVDSRHKKL